MSFDPTQDLLETPVKFFDLARKDPGSMLAFLRIALQELPEDNFHRRWIVNKINEEMAKL